MGPGHSMAWADTYIVSVLPEARPDTHNTRQRRGQSGIQDALEDLRRQKQQHLEGPGKAS